MRKEIFQMSTKVLQELMARYYGWSAPEIKMGEAIVDSYFEDERVRPLKRIMYLSDFTRSLDPVMKLLRCNCKPSFRGKFSSAMLQLAGEFMHRDHQAFDVIATAKPKFLCRVMIITRWECWVELKGGSDLPLLEQLQNAMLPMSFD